VKQEIVSERTSGHSANALSLPPGEYACKSKILKSWLGLLRMSVARCSIW